MTTEAQQACKHVFFPSSPSCAGTDLLTGRIWHSAAPPSAPVRQPRLCHCTRTVSSSVGKQCLADWGNTTDLWCSFAGVKRPTLLAHDSTRFVCLLKVWRLGLIEMFVAGKGVCFTSGWFHVGRPDSAHHKVLGSVQTVQSSSSVVDCYKLCAVKCDHVARIPHFRMVHRLLLFVGGVCSTKLLVSL